MGAARITMGMQVTFNKSDVATSATGSGAPTNQRKGCPFDTDGDGNCQHHPDGCPGIDPVIGDAMAATVKLMKMKHEIVHWRHAISGNAACGLKNPAKYVSNDAMLGVNCPSCLHVFRDKAGGGHRELRRKKEGRRHG